MSVYISLLLAVEVIAQYISTRVFKWRLIIHVGVDPFCFFVIIFVIYNASDLPRLLCVIECFIQNSLCVHTETHSQYGGFID